MSNGQKQKPRVGDLLRGGATPREVREMQPGEALPGIQQAVDAITGGLARTLVKPLATEIRVHERPDEALAGLGRHGKELARAIGDQFSDPGFLETVDRASSSPDFGLSILATTHPLEREAAEKLVSLLRDKDHGRKLLTLLNLSGPDAERYLKMISGVKEVPREE